MSDTVFVRDETSNDVEAIANVHLDAFGPNEPIPALVQRLRQLSGPMPTQSFVAHTATGDILGHVMISHGWLDAPDRVIDVLVLSPLGVAQSAQNKGIGSALIHHAVEAASQSAAPILFLEGNPRFYGPRGFEPSQPLGIRSPSLRIPVPALQMKRLPSYDPSMTGTLIYRDLWWELDCVGLR